MKEEEMNGSATDVQSEPEAQALLSAASETISADPEMLAAALLPWVRQRARRRTRARALVVAGMTAAVATGTALTIATSAAPPALAAVVTVAAAKTSAQTYHVSMLSTEVQRLTVASRSYMFRMLTTGEFDPAHHAYAEYRTPLSRLKDGGAWLVHSPELRVVGGYEYLRLPGRGSPRWIRANGQTAQGLPVPTRRSRTAPPDQQVNLADPQNLLSILKSVAKVRSDGAVSGAGWTGTRYSFTATGSAPGYSYSRAIMIGTVDVDQQGRVRHIAVDFSTNSALVAVPSSQGKIAVPSWRITENATFSDFGAPVSISPPPASQVITSNDLSSANPTPTAGASLSGHNG